MRCVCASAFRLNELFSLFHSYFVAGFLFRLFAATHSAHDITNLTTSEGFAKCKGCFFLSMVPLLLHAHRAYVFVSTSASSLFFQVVLKSHSRRALWQLHLNIFDMFQLHWRFFVVCTYTHIVSDMIRCQCSCRCVRRVRVCEWVRETGNWIIFCLRIQRIVCLHSILPLAILRQTHSVIMKIVAFTLRFFFSWEFCAVDILFYWLYSHTDDADEKISWTSTMAGHRHMRCVYWNGQ